MSESSFAVRIHGLSKEFARRRTHRTVLRALRSLAAVEGEDGPRRLSLDGIELEVPAGDLIGIVGENGAGKTTLLKTIAGMYVPTTGHVEVTGEVALLAGLGAGMVDDLTVADNIWLYSAVLRIRRSKIVEHFDDILEWAELKGYEGAELRTLSMGMRTRLAFAIAMQIESEIVLMDEAFSAGDKRFQAKCDRFFEESKNTDRTFLVATHNLEFVERFCDRTLWLHRGRVQGFGLTEDVLGEYVGFEAK